MLIFFKGLRSASLLNLLNIIIQVLRSGWLVSCFNYIYHLSPLFKKNYFEGKEIFQHYDLGKKGNLERYGTLEPSVYDMSKVTAPVYLYYGLNDLISTREVRENH